MNAAKAGSPEGIEVLLAAGADPNMEDNEGRLALAYAFISENIEVFDRLAPVTTTNVGVDNIITLLAQSNIKIEKSIGKDSICNRI